MTHGLWVVQRALEAVAGLSPDTAPAAHPDRTVVVPAMAEYVRFTGRQIGMPTIHFDGARERLRDGVRLLEALRLAGADREVACLWLADRKHRPPAGAEPFGPAWAERTGSGARLITFHEPLLAAQKGVLGSAWTSPPSRFGATSWGWTAREAAALPDWLTWYQQLATLLPRIPGIQALNGRQAPMTT